MARIAKPLHNWANVISWLIVLLMSALPGSDVGHRHACVGPSQRITHGVHVPERIAGRAQRVHHLVRLRKTLIVGKIHNRRDVFREAAISCVPGDADDFHVPPNLIVVGRQDQMLPQRVPAIEVRLGERFVDHGNDRRSGPVRFAEIASRQNRNLHRREEPRSDGHEARRRIGRLSSTLIGVPDPASISDESDTLASRTPGIALNAFSRSP